MLRLTGTSTHHSAGQKGPDPLFPQTAAIYVWHSTSHKHLKITAKLSRYHSYYVQSCGCHRQTDTDIPLSIVQIMLQQNKIHFY